MQKKEIKKAMDEGTEVAVVTRRAQDFPRYNVRRGVVVAMNAQHRNPGKGYGRGTPARDGIRVRFVDDKKTSSFNAWQRVVKEFVRGSMNSDEFEETDDRVVESRLIYATWPDYQRQLNDHEASAAAAVRKAREEEQRSAQERADCDDVVQQLKERGVAATTQCLGDYRSGYYYRVVLSAGSVKLLLAQSTKEED